MSDVVARLAARYAKEPNSQNFREWRGGDSDVRSLLEEVTALRAKVAAVEALVYPVAAADWAKVVRHALETTNQPTADSDPGLLRREVER